MGRPGQVQREQQRLDNILDDVVELTPRGIAAIVAGLSWVLLLLVAGHALTRAETGSSDAWVLGVASLALGLLAALTSIVMAIVAKRARLAVLSVVALGLGVAGGSAEDLHWRWSRNEFEQVAAGHDVECPLGERCRLGWWMVSGVDHFDNMTIVRSENSHCYAGFGYIAARGEDPGTAAMTELAQSRFVSNYLGVSPWRDGWYEFCIRT